ncbi:hypothetical protein F2Q69_00008546 [Brassica cretica]|uniref:Uncharacterized protein n=3 Tax=Brassica TaxID=3705 RepID=A0A0D3BJB9_BRAOL|nr:hypothetical protein F2Q69_00008546 [Brassica cretica]
MGGDDESTFRTHHHDDTVDEAVESLGRQMSENGDLRVGMGVLATDSHAVVIKTIFLVFYKPRISLPEPLWELEIYLYNSQLLSGEQCRSNRMSQQQFRDLTESHHGRSIRSCHLPQF